MSPMKNICIPMSPVHASLSTAARWYRLLRPCQCGSLESRLITCAESPPPPSPAVMQLHHLLLGFSPPSRIRLSQIFKHDFSTTASTPVFYPSSRTFVTSPLLVDSLGFQYCRLFQDFDGYFWPYPLAFGSSVRTWYRTLIMPPSNGTLRLNVGRKLSTELFSGVLISSDATGTKCNEIHSYEERTGSWTPTVRLPNNTCSGVSDRKVWRAGCYIDIVLASHSTDSHIVAV